MLTEDEKNRIVHDFMPKIDDLRNTDMVSSGVPLIGEGTYHALLREYGFESDGSIARNLSYNDSAHPYRKGLGRVADYLAFLGNDENGEVIVRVFGDWADSVYREDASLPPVPYRKEAGFFGIGGVLSAFHLQDLSSRTPEDANSDDFLTRFRNLDPRKISDVMSSISIDFWGNVSSIDRARSKIYFPDNQPFLKQFVGSMLAASPFEVVTHDAAYVMHEIMRYNWDELKPSPKKDTDGTAS